MSSESRKQEVLEFLRDEALMAFSDRVNVSDMYLFLSFTVCFYGNTVRVGRPDGIRLSAPFCGLSNRWCVGGTLFNVNLLDV